MAAVCYCVTIPNRKGQTIMENCKFYERDESAFAEHMDYMRHCAAEGQTYQPDEEPERPCYNFCKHYTESPGFPGETCCYCSHPENKGIDCGSYSVFDGVTDHDTRMRILDDIC